MEFALSTAEEQEAGDAGCEMMCISGGPEACGVAMWLLVNEWVEQHGPAERCSCPCHRETVG